MRILDCWKIYAKPNIDIQHGKYSYDSNLLKYYADFYLCKEIKAVDDFRKNIQWNKSKICETYPLVKWHHVFPYIIPGKRLLE